jgi:hypothetical protein
MQVCSYCARNANRNAFCGDCGEPILDPGFEKKIRIILGKERRRNWIKFTGAAVGIASILGLVEYETNTRLITTALQKAAPVVQAQLESSVQKQIESELPAIAAQARERVAVRVRQEFEDGYVQAARQEAERIKPDFQARLATIQAEEETKLRTVYQQAQNNVQPVSSITASWVGTALTPTMSVSGVQPTLTGLETPGHSPADDVLKLPGGSGTLTLSVTSTPIQSGPSGGICFTVNGMGSFDANGTCKPNTIVTPLSSTANLITTTQ